MRSRGDLEQETGCCGKWNCCLPDLLQKNWFDILAVRKGQEWTKPKDYMSAIGLCFVPKFILVHKKDNIQWFSVSFWLKKAQTVTVVSFWFPSSWFASRILAFSPSFFLLFRFLQNENERSYLLKKFSLSSYKFDIFLLKLLASLDRG